MFAWNYSLFSRKQHTLRQTNKNSQESKKKYT
jgi:hypothetical protein